VTHTTYEGYARYIGRVGALAFTLGVGIAVANSPAVAHADTGASHRSTHSSTSGSSSSSSAGPRQTATGSVNRAHGSQRVHGERAVSRRPNSTATTGSSPRSRLRATTVSIRKGPAEAITDTVAGTATRAADSPAAPPSVTVPEILTWARREADHVQAAAQATRSIGSTFFARTPVLAYNAAQNVQDGNGVITGTLNASQANGYALTYSITAEPQHGSVTVHPDGTYTYEPNAEFVSLGGTDTFGVMADDEPGNPPHWHGLATFFAPNGGATASTNVTVLENPGPAQPPSVLATTDQLDTERTVTQLANSPLVQLAKVVLKASWWVAARKNFSMVGGPDRANMAQLDQAVTEYAHQAAMEVQLLDSNNPKILQQVAPTHSWYLQDFAGTRIWYDNPDTIYRFVGVNNASSYVITGKFTGSMPADTNFSVLTGLSGTTADNINGKDLVVNPDGTFTITADSSPTAPGQTNHLQLVPGTTLITTRNTLSDWNTQDPMSLSILRVSGPPDSLFSQLGGFAIPGIGPLVSGNPLLTSLVSIIPPLPAPRLLQSVETAAIMLLLGISGENQYMSVATTDPTTGLQQPPNVLSDPGHNASFLSTQLQSAGYFQLADDQALVITIDPGRAGYFGVPVSNDWTITNNYWDEQTSLNISQSVANSDGTYTTVVSPTDPGVANWVSTGGLNQGTLSIRFQDLDPNSTVNPTVSSAVVPLDQLGTVLPSGTVYVTPEERRAQIAERQLSYNKRYAPYPQA